MISKDILVFDTTDANTIADSDHVGAHTLSGSGALIDSETINAVERLSVDSTLKDGLGSALTSTLVGGKQALDVYIAEGINVEVDLDAADDSVAAYLNDGAGNAIGSTGGAIHVSDAGGSLTVDATDLDIRDLVAATDSVTSYLADGAGTLLTSTLIGAKQSLDVNVVEAFDAALAQTAIAHAQKPIAVDDTAESVVASALANRKYLLIRNNGNRKMYIGGAGVDSASGFPLSPGSVAELRAGALVDVQVAGVAAGSDIRTLELA